MIRKKLLELYYSQVFPHWYNLMAIPRSPVTVLDFDREGWPTGAALLGLRIVQHLEWASDQFLAEVHLSPFHEGQAITVNHHSCPTLFKYPVVGVNNCIQWKFVLESGASTSLHLQPEEFWPFGDFQKPLDAAVCEADLSLASLWNGGRRFPPGQEPGRGREEPALAPGNDRPERRGR